MIYVRKNEIGYYLMLSLKRILLVTANLGLEKEFVGIVLIIKCPPDSILYNMIISTNKKRPRPTLPMLCIITLHLILNNDLR